MPEVKKRRSGNEGLWRGPQVEEFLELEKIAFFRAREKIPRFSDAEEIALKVMDLLLTRWGRGTRPRFPRAWVRRAVDRLAVERRKGGRSRVLSLEKWREERGREIGEEEDLRRRSRESGEWLEGAGKWAGEVLGRRLTRRQARAYQGIAGSRSLREAAREAGLSWRDFKQARKEILAKGKKLREKSQNFSPPPMKWREVGKAWRPKERKGAQGEEEFPMSRSPPEDKERAEGNLPIAVNQGKSPAGRTFLKKPEGASASKEEGPAGTGTSGR